MRGHSPLVSRPRELERTPYTLAAGDFERATSIKDFVMSEVPNLKRDSTMEVTAQVSRAILT